MTTNLFLAGLFTMAFASIRQQSRAAYRLRWFAITLNGVLIALGALGWIAHTNALGISGLPGITGPVTPASLHDLFPFDAFALIAIGMLNLGCIAMSRQFFGGRACQSCGYDLSRLRSDGCPECGWRREI